MAASPDPPLPSRPQDALRASHGDREQVVARLNAAFAEGRLDVHELDERVAAAYAARTVGELRPLTVDLPQPWQPDPREPAPAGTGAAPARRPGRGAETALRAHFTAWATAVSINVVIWVIVCLTAGELIYFWPAWVAGPWGAVVLVQYVATRGGRPRS